MLTQATKVRFAEESGQWIGRFSYIYCPLAPASKSSQADLPKFRVFHAHLRNLALSLL